LDSNIACVQLSTPGIFAGADTRAVGLSGSLVSLVGSFFGSSGVFSLPGALPFASTNSAFSTSRPPRVSDSLFVLKLTPSSSLISMS
jgi:hypothetical protein